MDRRTKIDTKRKQYLFITFTTIFIIVINVHISIAQEDGRPANKLAPQNPRYEIKLNLNEFSFLNSALVDGLDKYSGIAEFDLKIGKEGDNVFWTLSISNAQLIDVLGIYIAEKSLSIIKTIDIDNIDTQGKIAMRVAKSLSGKVDYAKKNPVWDLVQISGNVIEENGFWFIDGEEGKYKITEKSLGNLNDIKETPVVIYGFIKVKGQIEVTRFIKKKVNTLELFVMSLCPFGQQAEKKLIEFLENYSSRPKPILEIHYLFYMKNSDKDGIFASLHGEEEIEENLIQLVIRDKYPESFFSYLLLRAGDNEIPWFQIVEDIGLDYKDIQMITKTIEDERDALIQNEFNYVTKRYEIFDGSPTYVWESELVKDISKVKTFKGLKSSSLEACSQ